MQILQQSVLARCQLRIMLSKMDHKSSAVQAEPLIKKRTGDAI
jgi:hypothetical protein